MPKQRIAVLGAGPMGLAAAYQLAREGYCPVVFEGDDRVGGQAAAFDFEGLSIERFYHFHCTSDDEFFQVLEELGLQDKLHWRATKMGFYYQGKVLPWGNPVALLSFPSLSLAAKFRYGLHAFLCTKIKNWKPLDSLEASSWIRNRVGDEAYTILWQKLFDLKFYNFADKLSAAWIWSRIRRVGLSRYNLFKEKLGYLEGGSQTLLEAMRSYILKQGGEIRLGQPASLVRIESSAVQGVEAGGEFYPFEKVISTVPLPYVAQLMPGLPQSSLDKLKAQENIAVVCVIAKLKKSVSEYFWMNVNDPQMQIPGLVQYSNLNPGDHAQHIVYVPFYIPADHPRFANSNEQYIDEVKSYLKEINPALEDSDFTALHASRYRHAQPICRPGHLQSLPKWEEPVQGLWVADTSYYYPEDRGISESFGWGRMMAKKAMV